MKKIIKKLLIGFIPFLPAEKVQADEPISSIDTLETTLHFQDDDEGFATQNTQALNDVREALRLIDEMEAEEEKHEKKVVDLTNNIPLITNALFEAKRKTSNFFKKNLKPVHADSETSINSVSVKTDQKEDVQENSSSDLTKKNSTIAPSSTNIVSSLDQTPAVSINSISDPSISTNKILSSEVKEVAHAQTVVHETLPTNDEKIVTNGIPEELVELLDAEKHGKEPSPKRKNVSTQGTSWFTWGILGILGSLVSGAILFGHKLEASSQKKKDLIADSKNSMTKSIISEMIRGKERPEKQVVQQKVQDLSVSSQPLVSEKKSTPVQPAKIKTKEVRKVNPTLDANISDDEMYQKGLRMLSNIKIRRSKITSQIKKLRLEQDAAYLPIKEKMDLQDEIDVLQDERKQLALEARQARTLIKGKQGELIKEQRRLLAKEMRMARKENPNGDRVAKITQKRLALKQQEKQLLMKANAEIKERQEGADRWHGIRLFHEAQQEERKFNEKIKEIQKETGLRKKDILSLDRTLNAENKAIKAKKALARKKVKSHFLEAQKRRLAKEIRTAHENTDMFVEDQLKKELEEVRQKEKEYIKNAQNFDYIIGKRSVIKPAILERVLAREAEQAHRQQLIEENKKRVITAQFLRGQRMLRDLDRGLVEAVNFNRISWKEYRSQAEALLGAEKGKKFNYEQQRASYLKPTTLGRIYLSKQKRGLI